jgi:predicted Zn-dependent protease
LRRRDGREPFCKTGGPVLVERDFFNGLVRAARDAHEAAAFLVHEVERVDATHLKGTLLVDRLGSE